MQFARVQGAGTVLWTRYKGEDQANRSNTIEGQHHVSLLGKQAVKRESHFLSSDKQLIAKGQDRGE